MRRFMNILFKKNPEKMAMLERRTISRRCNGAFWLNLVALIACAFTAYAGTWSEVFTDSFNRPDSAFIGNNWSDPAGTAKISNNTLTITTPARDTGLSVRVARPDSEASLYQRIEATFTMPEKDGLAHGAFVRGKSLVIGGQEIYPVILVNARHSGALSTVLSYKGGAGTYATTSGTGGFTPEAGHSYTLAVQITNNFPSILSATLTDNNTSSQVAGVTLKDSAQYGNVHMSPDFKTPGVMGLAMEGVAGKSVSFSKVTTYKWTETGPLTAACSPVFKQHDGKTYLAAPFPEGGSGPYSIRWYRGDSGFTPPLTADGSGSGTGTYLGNSFEQVDTTAPAGVSTFAISYRAVYFDGGANATTGILGAPINVKSPDSKGYAIPFWIGDSITAGYATSKATYTKSPATYAEAFLKVDSAFSDAYTMPIAGAMANFGLSGKTSADMVGRLPQILGQTRFLGSTFVGIMLGTNDSKNSVATAPAQYKANIQTLIAGLKAVRGDIKIVLNKPLWFTPDTGFGNDFSTASLARVAEYRTMLDQLADGTNIVVGSLTASNEIQTCGWTGTSGKPNVANSILTYPPTPTAGQSFLVDGLHPYDGGSEMIGKLEWGPNAKKAILGNFTPAKVQ